FGVAPVGISAIKYQHVFIRTHQVIALLRFRLFLLLLSPALTLHRGAFFLRGFAGMQPTGNYARVGSAICPGNAVTVAVLTCDCDRRQWFTAGALALSLPDE